MYKKVYPYLIGTKLSKSENNKKDPSYIGFWGSQKNGFRVLCCRVEILFQLTSSNPSLQEIILGCNTGHKIHLSHWRPKRDRVITDLVYMLLCKRKISYKTKKMFDNTPPSLFFQLLQHLHSLSTFYKLRLYSKSATINFKDFVRKEKVRDSRLKVLPN